MRLIDTETGQFVDKDPEKTEYAILSHTWDDGEQTYEKLKKIQERYRLRSHVPESHPPSAGQSSTSWLNRLVDSSKVTTSTPICTSVPGTIYALSTYTPTSLSPELPSKMLRHAIWRDHRLSPKIRHACAVARKNGYRYIWIDSCCIDKSSSSELSEAINSMYKWYDLADVCYAYLADVPPGEDHQAEDSRFRESRWFTRGWTLQELIAPIKVEFLSADWTPIGSKHALVDLVESTTGISHRALLHVEPLRNFSVAQRLSWAARRKTTRVEDKAYSLLGIFNIHMPTLYGEGDHAFQRLQEQIMQRIPDQSLFAWGKVYLPDPSQLLRNPNQIPIHNSITIESLQYLQDLSLLAPSPQQFWYSPNIQQADLPASLRHEIGYTSTPYGIRTQFQMIHLTPDLLSRILLSNEVHLQLPDDSNQWYLAILGCEHTERPGYLLGRVCCIPPSQSGVDLVYAGYIRSSPTEPGLFPLSPDTIKDFRPHLELKTVYIPHPDPANQFLSLRVRTYNTIRLVLLTETRDALRSRGYHADLRDPDPDHPTTHWLTLSNDAHAITVEFQCTLQKYGWRLTIKAEVKMSGSRVQPDAAADSDQADHHTMSWSDYCTWETMLGPKTVRLNAAGGKTLTVELSLDFGGMGFYYVRVGVRSDAPPAPADVDLVPPTPPAVESAGEQVKEVEVTGNDSPSGVVNAEDWETGREVEAGGHGMTSVKGVREFETAGDTAEGEERGGLA